MKARKGDTAIVIYTTIHFNVGDKFKVLNTSRSKKGAQFIQITYNSWGRPSTGWFSIDYFKFTSREIKLRRLLG